MSRGKAKSRSRRRRVFKAPTKLAHLLFVLRLSSSGRVAERWFRDMGLLEAL